MSVTRIAPPAAAEHTVLDLLQGLAEEAETALKSFTAKPPADLPTLTRQVGDLFSLVVDLASHCSQAIVDHDEALAVIEDQLGDESRLTPTDAGRLKAVILSLLQNLREPSDDLIVAVRARAAEAIAFIDEATMDDDEGDDENEDPEDGDPDAAPQN